MEQRLKEKDAHSLPIDVVKFLDHLSVEKGSSKNTLLAYKRDFFEFFSRFDSLDAKSVMSYLAEMRASGLSENTISRRISSLRSLENFLCISDANRIPWKVEIGRKSRRLPKAIAYDSLRRLIESPTDDPTGLRDRAILETLYATGMRVSELVSLEVSQLAISSEEIAFLRISGKGGKERIVPLGGHAMKACHDYLVRGRPIFVRSARESALFLNSNGRRLTRQGIWQIIKRAAMRAQVSDRITPHSFRHSFATHMIERGADVRAVQELLGHASVVTTQIYTLITQDILRETHAESHPRAR